MTSTIGQSKNIWRYVTSDVSPHNLHIPVLEIPSLDIILGCMKPLWMCLYTTESMRPKSRVLWMFLQPSMMSKLCECFPDIKIYILYFWTLLSLIFWKVLTNQECFVDWCFYSKRLFSYLTIVKYLKICKPCKDFPCKLNVAIAIALRLDSIIHQSLH